MTGVGHDRHLSVSVNAPSGLLVSTVDDAKGQINFEAEETGDAATTPKQCKNTNKARHVGTFKNVTDGNAA